MRLLGRLLNFKNRLWCVHCDAVHSHRSSRYQSPVASRPYRSVPLVQKKVDAVLDQYLEAGLIQHSTSPWASPLAVIPQGSSEIQVGFRAFYDCSTSTCNRVSQASSEYCFEPLVTALSRRLSIFVFRFILRMLLSVFASGFLLYGVRSPKPAAFLCFSFGLIVCDIAPNAPSFPSFPPVFLCYYTTLSRVHIHHTYITCLGGTWQCYRIFCGLYSVLVFNPDRQT